MTFTDTYATEKVLDLGKENISLWELKSPTP
jgi:hypothetical protein